jgi:membrane associated rhomboid family serine protease
MTSLLQDIQDKLKRLNVLEHIIVINIVVFVIGFLLSKIGNFTSSLYWLELPRSFSEFLLKPWTLITYGFTHYEFFHILFNLLVLYFVSRMMLNLFSSKMALSIYFLGIIAGGMAFLLVYNLLPQNLLNPASALVGASAGVRALLIFICAYMPKTEVRVVFFNMKLWHLGIVVVALDIIGLFSTNQGGSIAHLGGSLLGYAYATQLQNGTDIGKWFQEIIDWITQLFQPGKKSPLKTVHKRKRKDVIAGHTTDDFKAFNKQKQIDIILDKISKSGYESLTEAEKAFLFKAKD